MSDQLDEQNDNDSVKELFYHNGYETLDKLFTRRFADREEEIKQLAGPDKKAFQQYVGKSLKAFVDVLEPELIGALPSVEDKLESVTKIRDRLRSRRDNLRDQKAKHKKKTGKKAAKAYIALYVVLLLGSMVFYAYTLPIIMPEVPRWAGIIQSLFLAAPSFLAAEFHKLSQYKDKILRWLIIAGLVSSAGLVISIGIARVTANNIMSKAASGSFLQTGATSSGLETLLSVSVFLVFLFGILTEITFSSSILIRVKQDYEDEIPNEQVETALSAIKPELMQVMAEYLILSQLKAQIIKFPEVSQSWCEEEKDKLSNWYDKHQEELLKKAAREFNSRPPNEQLRLVQ